MKFNRGYFLAALSIFFLEIFIAIFVHDDFIRPYFGDFLVVVLLYCALKSITIITVEKAALVVLLFSYGIELSQYFHLVELLGWEKNRIAYILLGNYFSWEDLIAYTSGIIGVLLVEKLFLKPRTQNKLASK